MKKEYISPAMECIELKTNQCMLTVSNPRIYNTEVSDGDGEWTWG